MLNLTIHAQDIHSLTVFGGIGHKSLVSDKSRADTSLILCTAPENSIVFFRSSKISIENLSLNSCGTSVTLHAGVKSK